MKKTIAEVEEQLRDLRRKYRELRDSYNKFYREVDSPSKRELWYYSTPMNDSTLRELFLSVHSANRLGYDCVLTAEGACTDDKKLHVTFVAKRPEKPMALVNANYTTI